LRKAERKSLSLKIFMSTSRSKKFWMNFSLESALFIGGI